VRVHRKLELGGDAEAGDQLAKAGRRERGFLSEVNRNGDSGS
jgi:hypothetical protein